MTSFEECSCKEKKAIEELQMRTSGLLTPAMLEEGTLVYYRFLKARDFDVDKAEKMLRKAIIWRKTYQIETIVEDFKPTEVFMKYLLPRIVGYDKEGNIVRYVPCGKINLDDAPKCFHSYSNYMKHWYWFAESTVKEVIKENRKTGGKGYKCTIIFDCDQLTFATITSKIVIDMVLFFIIAYQDNHPERLKGAFAINAPRYFLLLYSIVKNVMSSETINKINIYGKSGWKEKLLEFIDADVLPEFLGGNRTDPDGNPLCHTIVNHESLIPQSYILSKEDKYFRDADLIRKLTVAPTKKAEINVEINYIGSVIHWEFFVKGKDIGFGLFLQESDGKTAEIIPVHNCSTPDGTEKDFHKCRHTGNYIIVFDNSYSWMTTKEIQYCINVVNTTL